MSAPVIDLTIQRGKTFEYGFLYADDVLEYRPIAAMTKAAPVRLSVPAHGIPDGWPVSIAGVKHPAELNTDECAAPLFARFVDVDTIELNTINASAWRTFQASGDVVFQRPADLSGWSARGTVRDRVGGAELLRWHSDPLVEGAKLITVDTAHSAFVLHIDAETTAGLPWSRGMWELEAIDPDGKVYPVVAPSRITVTREVAT